MRIHTPCPIFVLWSLLGSEVWIIEGSNNRGSDRNLSLRSDHSCNVLINLGIFTAVGDSLVSNYSIDYKAVINYWIGNGMLPMVLY